MISLIEELIERKLGKSQVRMWRRLRRNRNIKVGGVLVLGFIFMGLLAPWISPYDPLRGKLIESLSPPSWKHLFGTDIQGRDILSRVIWGARTSMIVAFFSIAIAVTAGTLAGSVAGFLGGWVDNVVSRVVDIMLALPDILLALFVAAIIGPGLENVILAIALYNFPQFARISRASVINIKQEDYIEAAKAIGERDVSVLLRYILPNSLAPVIVHATLRTAASILTAAGLSFLGLGVQPPTPEWGAMLSDARTYLVTAPYVWIFPGLALTLTALGFNLLGDGLNDVLNPRIEV